MVWSQPGAGKSSITYQVSKSLKRPMFEFRATLLDPVDLRGLMWIKDGKTFCAPPSFLPDKKVKNPIVFIDELPTAPPMVQAALYQLILDKRLGEYELPPNTMIIAAGNRESDRAAVNRMPSPLANRFVHLYLEIDYKDWIDWAIEAKLRIEVIAFVRFRPSVLNAFDPENKDKAQPTPRTMEFVSNILNGNGKDLDTVTLNIIEGTIGKGYATELWAFLEDWKLLPDPGKILANPSASAIPSKPSVIYAVCQALAKIVTRQTADNFYKFAQLLKDDNKVDFAIAMISDATKREPLLKETKGYVNWTTKNSYLYAS